MDVIYVGGTFDCLHSGHINLFKRAGEYGKVVVSLNTDEFAERYKRKPLMPLEERMAVVRELRCVDDVIINEGDEDSKPAILKAKATYICHGDDWVGDSYLKQLSVDEAFLEAHNIKLLYLPYTPNISTTKILCQK
jgi:glycerol-3-phosphate cytidylyltransferase